MECSTEADASCFLIKYSFKKKQNKTKTEHLLCSFIPCKPSSQGLEVLLFVPLLRAKVRNLLGHSSLTEEGGLTIFYMDSGALRKAESP